jgi:7-cyano-7-deazaguanine synthase in queuosine biosynthesis
VSNTAADLLNFAAAVYQIERQLSGRQRTNPPERFELKMPLRSPDVWDRRVIQTASSLLNVLGNATWTLQFTKSKLRPIDVEGVADRTINQVMLLSGGLDSACGAASRTEKKHLQPVSFYTRQKTLQQDIARGLGLLDPVQWRMDWKGEAGRGHSFLYRSFLFLSLAAVTVASWGGRSILQFENGILATAIPPSDAWMMTKHAHPAMTALASELFSLLLGGDWKIENPFLLQTKRQCVDTAVKAAGLDRNTLLDIFAQTETCWFHWSNRVPGGKKKPGIACGTCIPCILRRTALPKTPFAFDLRKDSVRNHPDYGVGFRSYFVFLKRVLEAGSSDASFYPVMPAAGRNLVGTGRVRIGELRALFARFAREFMETYGF